MPPPSSSFYRTYLLIAWILLAGELHGAAEMVGIVVHLEVAPCAVAHVVELFPALVAGLDAAAVLVRNGSVAFAAVLMRTIQKIPGGSIAPPPGTNQTNNYQ